MTTEKPISFRPTPATKEDIEKAMEVLGTNKTSTINLLISIGAKELTKQLGVASDEDPTLT